MPIKFRCPHCFRTLLADEETVGQPKPCPACGQIMHVPVPIERADEPVRPPPVTCPRCKTEAAPTATFCLRCFTVFASGKRMPWRERAKHLPWPFWAAIAGGGLVLFLLLLAGFQFARIHLKQPTTRPFAGVESPAADTTGLAADLLGASSPEARRAALAALAGAELQTLPTIAAALEQSVDGGPETLDRTRNQLAAIELMVRHRDAAPELRERCISALRRAEQSPALRSAALRARALLGDQDAAEPLTTQWLEALDRALFMEKLGAATSRDAAGARRAIERARAAADRLADGLRRLGRGDDRAVFERVAARSWDTWGWLGQTEGLGATIGLFDLARPADATLRFDPADVRRPRDIMRELAERAAPGVRAAAALALVNVPQYRTLTDRVVQTLAREIRGADAADQQRLVWVISYLRGKRFTQRELRHPLDVTAAEVAAAQAWAEAAAPPVTREPYPEPPHLKYHAVTPRRQLAVALGARLVGDWAGSAEALDLWLTARLGVAPRVRELLAPTQRAPDMPGLAAALVIAGVSGGAEERQALELWRDAREQPAWVRALAHTALAGIDLRSGGRAVTWPQGVDFGPSATLDAGTPGWGHFGRIIAAGGPAMRELVGKQSGKALPASVQAKLLDAAARAAERVSALDGP